MLLCFSSRLLPNFLSASNRKKHTLEFAIKNFLVFLGEFLFSFKMENLEEVSAPPPDFARARIQLDERVTYSPSSDSLTPGNSAEFSRRGRWFRWCRVITTIGGAHAEISGFGGSTHSVTAASCSKISSAVAAGILCIPGKSQ